ncbi:MAG: hypothetical protein MP439_03990 [Ferrimicrobium sp.]|nr:hypothetical protein [Ferrimicrobium sp.]
MTKDTSSMVPSQQLAHLALPVIGETSLLSEELSTAAGLATLGLTTGLDELRLARDTCLAINPTWPASFSDTVASFFIIRRRSSATLLYC